MLEIYNEKIRDLLAKNVKNTLQLRENPDTGVYVNDLT
jgi:kinesin family protein 3/17